MTDRPRLIEVAFPLQQASLDSVHEKNVRHGHISTLHIWPARRPLAACRAALLATLLPDPGDEAGRKRLLERIGGKVVRKVEKKKLNGRLVEVVREVTVGGVLHWGREDAEDMARFRAEVLAANGGRPPRVLDPFAGGGAIPLEAMRLGCEATAIDINPVAWFILKCTLEYPQKLAGQKRPLPAFVLDDEEFMADFYKAHPGLIGSGKPSSRQIRTLFDNLHEGHLGPPEADLAWHVRAWGKWVLGRARRELARFYPTYAAFEPVQDTGRPFEKCEPRPVPVKEDGTADAAALNAEFGPEYLADRRNPRWVAKPTVAYLWARTVKCKNCRATVPLLKTRWLCKKDKKRVVLTMETNADRTGVVFGVRNDVPAAGGNTAQKREHDKRLGGATMSRSGTMCPCCQAVMIWDDLRTLGQAPGFGSTLVAVVVDGQHGKEYRTPQASELRLATEAQGRTAELFEAIPFGLPLENTPEPFGPRRHGASLRRYGMLRWVDVFTPRQLLALGTFARWTRDAGNAMRSEGYSGGWVEAVTAYLGLAFDRLADYSSTICSWHNTGEKLRNTFGRFAFPIVWDFAEVLPTSLTSGGYAGAIEWIGQYIGHALELATAVPPPKVLNRSSTRILESKFDLVMTDPPYYDAISYCDLMDFFHVWLRRVMGGCSPEFDAAFHEALGPKWDHQANDGELVDDPSRHGWDRAKSKAVYEDGMYRSFVACSQALQSDGRLVIVFAHKQPDAWETLVSAIIRAGFVVDASWPIQTEMGNRTRALTSAALSSSVWLVCKKRPTMARPGWDNRVLEDMRANIHQRLRAYWDAGIRGPDFVWAATGPALEAYSKHPVVKKANRPGEVMEVGEFLRHVRRLVVDFVVGRVLPHTGDGVAVSGLDDVTTYYLLHRYDFGLGDAPIGPCILYAVSCGLEDTALAGSCDLLVRTGGKEAEEEGDAAEGDDNDTADGSGSRVKLKAWNQRKRPGMGYEASVATPRARQQAAAEGTEPAVLPRAVPLIDKAHRLMHLWKAGDVVRVDEYIDARALRKNPLFGHLLQALIELAGEGGEERALLEAISNHLAARGRAPGHDQESLPNLDNPNDSPEE